jgi:adenosylhomocysteinase
MNDESRAARAAAEIGRINAFFPIMQLLGNRWARSRPFEGRKVGVRAHLTTLTAALVRELTLGGGSWTICAMSPATTDRAVVDMLRDEGLEVSVPGGREDAIGNVLAKEPQLLVDCGGDLIKAAIHKKAEIRGAVEMTRSGVDKLRELELPFGVVNINDGRLKRSVENRHGVGEGLWHAVQRMTGMHLSGRHVAVIGYGPVGCGVAQYARAAGAIVDVVERDPVRRLVCHYDGFPTPSLKDALSAAGIAVTCTGSKRVLPIEVIRHGARDGLVLLNAGHGGDELDVTGIKDTATGIDQIADHVVRYQLEGGPKVIVLGDGHPLNIVTNSGSPEPVLLHFAVLGLALEWIAKEATLQPGEIVVPDDLENQAAELALQALGMAHG